MKRLIVFASGYGSNLGAIINACTDGSLSAKVVAVVSDRKAAFALERANQFDIPSIYHPWSPYKESVRSRQDYDADLAEMISVYNPDYVVLAGWMRLLTMSFLKHYPMRVINLHPALPGALPGTHAIERAYDLYRSEKISHTGVMVHYVPDEGVDDGPVILQEIIPIYPEDTLEILEERIHATEHRIFVNALKKVIQNN